jgi:rare lipoprotein A
MSGQTKDHKNTAFGTVLVILLWSNALTAQGADRATTLLALAEKPSVSEGSESAPGPDATNQGAASFSGNISWYGMPFHGKPTASGEIFDMNKFSAAHLTLPFGTKVLVEDPRTGNTVMVRINDRGPHVKTRVMDVSKGAATKLGTISRGVAYVDCLVVSKAGT